MQDTPAAPSDADLRAILSDHQDLEGPLLPILHAVQRAFGHIPDRTLPMIAATLNISEAELHGVISFYHDFRRSPGGRHIVKICRAEACQAVGGRAVAEHAMSRLGVDWHGTTPAGTVTLEPVYCLGLCACGPAVMVDDCVVGRTDPARMDELLDELGA